MSRFTYRVELAYDGSAFCGFARQPGSKTVEGALVDALRSLVPELTRVSVGGRTDRGVHATGQVVSFWSRVELDPDEVAAAIDESQPSDWAVREVRLVPRWFHASFSARERRYVYLSADEGDVPIDRLDRMLGALVGRRCFGAFARDTARGAPTVRNLREARARHAGDGQIRMDFAADGYLRRQIRVLVATALREAHAGAPEDVLVRIADSGDRRRTAPPADPGGLTLTRVSYEPR
jgi:tRNA pseudouridine38-40 synthase